MNQSELEAKLKELLRHRREKEWVEWKLNNKSYQQIGEYLSAISNSAALYHKDHGYIVWGIDNETGQVVGTNFKPHQEKQGNEEIENWLTRLLDPRINFRIYEFPYNDLPVVLFEIQPAFRKPVRFKGTGYIRVGSYKKKLKDVPEKERELWLILSNEDWSAGVIKKATINDLDPRAIEFAKRQYKRKNPDKTPEIDHWDDVTFLNKVNVLKKGKVTRTAIILLGKEESEHYLEGSISRISWFLRDENDNEVDYVHFNVPLILAVDKVLERIRNLKYRYMPDDTLFPEEIYQYDPWVIRETLHNCIAHQDYLKRRRIQIVEKPGSLLFTNPGKFIPGSVEDVIRSDSPPDYYRNRFLADAMFRLGMIDTQGGGIKRMFNTQKERFFPMPDYDLSESETVKVRIFGKIINENYTRMLRKIPALNLFDVIALDKVQKGKPITKEEQKRLKDKNLIEGRRPNFYISAKVADATETKAEYVRKRAFDKKFYKELVVQYLERFGEATRRDIDGLLISKISDVLTEKQKKQFIANLLQEMRKAGMIKPEGVTRWTKWVISKNR